MKYSDNSNSGAEEQHELVALKGQPTEQPFTKQLCDASLKRSHQYNRWIKRGLNLSWNIFKRVDGWDCTWFHSIWDFCFCRHDSKRNPPSRVRGNNIYSVSALQTCSREHQATAIPCRTTENTDQLLGITQVLAVAQPSLTIEVSSLPGYPLAQEPGLLIRGHR
jgi:hypothetical protein